MNRQVSALSLTLALSLLVSCNGSGGGGGGSSSPMPSPPPAPAASISPSALADATVGTSYTQDVSVPPFAGPYIWSVSSGSLPPGIQLGGSTSTVNTLSGTPTMAGTFAFTIHEQCQGKMYSANYMITVH